MIQELVDEVRETAKTVTKGMHTAVPCTIVTYDASAGLASVQPKAKYKKPDGNTMDYPLVSGVPVVFPQSQNVTIAFAVKPGDDCLLVFAENALDYWLYGQETDTDLKFDLSNAIAIPNIRPVGNAVMQEACSEDAAIVQVGGTKLKVKSDGIFIVGDVKVEGEITCSGDVKANNSISLANHVHPGDSGGTTGKPK